MKNKLFKAGVAIAVGASFATYVNNDSHERAACKESVVGALKADGFTGLDDDKKDLCLEKDDVIYLNYIRLGQCSLDLVDADVRRGEDGQTDDIKRYRFQLGTKDTGGGKLSGLNLKFLNAADLVKQEPMFGDC